MDEHDFGTIWQDSRHEFIFTFTNTGDAPLFIESAKGSCGCTIPEYSKNPVAPGEKGQIKAIYSPGKQKSQQVKTISITANTEPRITRLKIKAFVRAHEDGLDLEEPDEIVKGPSSLQFETEEHDFGEVSQGKKMGYSFKFKNVNSEPVTIRNVKSSCGCMMVSWPKEPIVPNGEGELKLIYDTGSQGGTERKSITVVYGDPEEVTVLKIKARVYPKEELEDLLEVFDPLAEVQEQIKEHRQGPVTTVQFDRYEMDLGQVSQGTENEMIFSFTNTGDEPLVIHSAKGSCGCTVPYFPKDPIMPGEQSEVHAVYSPGKQKGLQNKTLTIVANTDPDNIILRVKAEVLEVDDLEEEASLFAEPVLTEKDQEMLDELSPGCFVIFPNPTSETLQLDLKEHIGRSAEVRIHNEQGAEMHRSTIANISRATTRLEVGDFPSGLYVISIQVNGEKPMSQCFVVTD